MTKNNTGYIMVRHDCLEELNKSITHFSIIFPIIIYEPFGEKIYNIKVTSIRESEWDCKFQSLGSLTIYKEVEDLVTDY